MNTTHVWPRSTAPQPDGIGREVWRGRKTGVPGEKPSESDWDRLKLSPHTTRRQSWTWVTEVAQVQLDTFCIGETMTATCDLRPAICRLDPPNFGTWSPFSRKKLQTWRRQISLRKSWKNFPSTNWLTFYPGCQRVFSLTSGEERRRSAGRRETTATCTIFLRVRELIHKSYRTKNGSVSQH